MSLIETAIRRLQEESHGRPPALAGVPGRRADVPSAVAEVARTAEAAGERAPVPFDVAALRSAGLLPPEDEEALLARQYRQIKRPLIARALGHGVPRTAKGDLIMIASAMAGEGKSFTAVNLALNLSLEKDLRVLLVDADVAKPHISRVLGLAGEPGLLDVLRDPAFDVARVIRPTDVPTLSILPAGTASHEATELLSSDRMEQVAAGLVAADGHRLVLFDSPPLLQTNESQALAQLAGQIVVVVRAGFTPQPVLLDALKTLEGHGTVSLVLNQSTRAASSPYYYYGYGTERATPAERS